MDTVNPEVRARIIAAADQLFEAGGRSDFPPVDAVRRVARADMNTTSAVMKEWRRMQTTQPAAVAVAIPERVQAAQQAALAELWRGAQELANEALAAAKQAWEAERAEAEVLRAELSQAFEAQAEELAAAQARIAELEGQLKESSEAIDQVYAELAQAQEKEHTATARVTEIERRVEDLRAELDRSHRALAEHANAREDAARMSGELDALRAQNATLLAMLRPAESVAQAKPARKPRADKSTD